MLVSKLALHFFINKMQLIHHDHREFNISLV